MGKLFRRALLVLFAGLALAAAGLAAAAPRLGRSVGSMSSTSLVVGPRAASTPSLVQPSPAVSAPTPSPAPAAGAAQLVSGVTASAVGVALQGSQVRFLGTEPAVMSVQKGDSSLVATITPR